MDRSIKKENNLFYISFLQVIGPLLVIIGHMTNGLPYNQILNPIKSFIYVFHMPLFFFISGYLFSYKGGIRTSYKEHITKKILRLLFPYVILNLLFIIPKIVLGEFLSDDVEISFIYFIKAMFYPRNNILGHTWFLLALFIIYAFAPVFDYILKRKNCIIWTILVISLITTNLFAIDTNLLAIGDLCKDTLYFAMGMLVALIPLEKIDKKLTKKKFILGLIPLIVFSILWAVYTNKVTTLILCTYILFALLLLPIIFKIKNEKVIEFSKNSFSIYILHWPCMLFTRIILYQIMKINSVIVSFFMIGAGIVGPLLIIKVVKFIKNKYKINSKMLYYLIGV